MTYLNVFYARVYFLNIFSIIDNSYLTITFYDKYSLINKIRIRR